MQATRLRQKIARRFLASLVENPRGRAFALSVAADAEATDEGRIFDELLRHIEDPELAKLVRIHKADEERHATMFAEASRRVGVTPPPIPDELRFLERLERNLGGVLSDLLADGADAGIMRAYLLLQVVEERAVTQFKLLGPALARVDSHAADVVESIARDEERHLKYCRAISKRYAPSEQLLADTLQRFRRVEAVAFGQHTRASLRHALDNELIQIGPVLGLLVRGLVELGERRQVPVPTPFHSGDAVVA